MIKEGLELGVNIQVTLLGKCMYLLGVGERGNGIKNPSISCLSKEEIVV